MGRKALNKARKTDPAKVTVWMTVLFPKVQEMAIHKLTMDEYAALVGVTKATLYAYLPGKEALLKALLAEKLKGIAAYQGILSDDSLPHTQRLEKVLAQLAGELEGISNNFLSLLQKHFPAVWRDVEAFLELAFEHLGRFYASGMQAGSFRTFPPALLIANDRLYFRLMTDPDFLSGHGLSVQQALQSYLDLRFHGLISGDTSQ